MSLMRCDVMITDRINLAWLSLLAWALTLYPWSRSVNWCLARSKDQRKSGIYGLERTLLFKMFFSCFILFI